MILLSLILFCWLEKYDFIKLSDFFEKLYVFSLFIMSDGCRELNVLFMFVESILINCLEFIVSF